MYTLILTFVPLAFFIGVSASAIGITAWSVMVPLFFVVFGFDLYLTLFISLLVDCVNALLMTILAWKSKRINFRIAPKLILLSCLVVFPTASDFSCKPYRSAFFSSAIIAQIQFTNSVSLLLR